MILNRQSKRKQSVSVHPCCPPQPFQEQQWEWASSRLSPADPCTLGNGRCHNWSGGTQNQGNHTTVKVTFLSLLLLSMGDFQEDNRRFGPQNYFLGQLTIQTSHFKHFKQFI